MFEFDKRPCSCYNFFFAEADMAASDSFNDDLPPDDFDLLLLDLRFDISSSESMFPICTFGF